LVFAVVGCVGSVDDPGPHYSATFDRPLMAGAASTQCQIVELANPEAFEVGAIVAELEAADRVVVYRVDDDAETVTAPHDCASYDGARARRPLVIARGPRQVLEFPNGIGIVLHPHQRVLLEVYDRESASPQMQHVDVRFEAAAQPIHDLAGMMYVATADLQLPPNAAQLVEARFAPPPELADAKFIAFTGHTRGFGVAMAIATVAEPTADKVLVYAVSPFHGDAPSTKTFTTPVRVPPHGEFYFQCTYFNNTQHVIQLGVGPDDEACGFWAIYYPAVTSGSCSHSETNHWCD
jgi:hypothetical protein